MNKIRRILLFTSLSLMIAFTFSLHPSLAHAQELEDINPLGGFEFNVLLNGQSTGSISTSAAAPFDVLSVGVVSIGNNTLTASLNMTSAQSGIWWITLAGTGGNKWADFAFGLAPLTGPSVQIDISESVGFAVATGGIVSLTPVTEEEPLKYSISVTGR